MLFCNSKFRSYDTSTINNKMLLVVVIILCLAAFIIIWRFSLLYAISLIRTTWYV